MNTMRAKKLCCWLIILAVLCSVSVVVYAVPSDEPTNVAEQTTAVTPGYVEVLQDSDSYPESEHNYANNANITYTYQVEGADYLKITFSSNTLVESNCDYIYILDGNGTEIGKYTGNALSNKTIQVTGNTVKIKLTSDGSVQKYGFSLSSIYAGFCNSFTSAEITTLPTRLAYVVGEAVDLRGIEVTATKTDGTTTKVGVDYGITLLSADTSTKGRKTVTIGCGNLELQFQIGVHSIVAGEQLMDKADYPESNHNYSNNMDKTWTYTVAGADYLKLTFSSDTKTESGCDFIYLYDGADVELGKYSGTELRNKTITVTGETVKIRLDTDGDEKYYGFALTSIYAANAALHEMDGGVYTPHTCTANAYTTYSCTICTYSKKEIHANTAAHSWDEGVYTAPTCTADGYTTYTCTVCKKTQTGKNTGSALGHSMNEGVYTAPDCFADGFTTSTCTVCGYASTVQDTGTAFHTFENGNCTTCGVFDTVITGGWMDGKNTYWAMLPGNVLYLGGNGAAKYVSTNRSKMTSATSVVIGEGITILGDSCLSGLTKLTTINIPDTVTEIGRTAFSRCTGLRTLFIPASVTRILGTDNTDSPVYNCSSDLQIFCEVSRKPTGWSLYGFYYEGYAVVSPCYNSSRQEYLYWTTLDTAIASITIPDYVKHIPNKAFYNNTTLRYVYIPSSVSSVGSNAFFGCNSSLKIFCGKSSGYESYWNSTSNSSYSLLSTSYGVTVEEFNYWSTLDKSATSIEIPDYVTTIPNHAFSDCSSLKSVTMSDSVTTIQDEAFYNKSGLTSVVIGNGVTKIGKNAFYGCTGLKSIYIPETVTSISASNTSSSPFYNCSSKMRIYCGSTSRQNGWDSYWNYYATGSTYGTGSALTTIYNVPAEEYSFWATLDTTQETIVIPENITIIPNDVFRDVTTLKEITISGDVTTIGEYAFYGCTGLTKVTIAEGVTEIGREAFRGCTSLKEIYIPASLVKVGYDAFYNCTALEMVHVADLSAWCGIEFKSNSNPLSYGYLYLDGQKVTDVVIPADVTVIADYAFYYPGMTSVMIHADVQKIGYCAFDGCTGLEEVHVEDLSAWCAIKFDTRANPLSYGYLYIDGQKVTDVVIPSDVTSLGAYCFSYSGMTSVTIPSSVTEVQKDAFSGASKLAAVYISDLEVWCQIDFGNAWANPLMYANILYVNGQVLTELVIPEGVEYIGRYAFANYTSLTSVVIPASVTQIHEGAFYYCSALADVSFTEGLQSIGKSAFYCCQSLWQIQLPSTLTGIEEKAFYSCDKVTSVVIPNQVTFLGADAFYRCTALESVTLSDSLTSIGANAFYQCGVLVGVTLPENVTSIGSAAFCQTALTEITIPAAVKNIGANAFSGCSALKEIRFLGNAPSIGSGAFQSVTAQAHYPYYGANWDEKTLVNYGGSLTWHIGSDKVAVSQGDCGTDVHWLLDEAGTLIIYGNGAMNDYSYSSGKTTAPWKGYVNSVTKLVIDNGVTYIGNDAFYGCSKLNQITFQGDCPTFASYAFRSITANASYRAANITWLPSALSGFGGYITWTPIGMSEEYLAGDMRFTSTYWKLDHQGTLTLYDWNSDYSYYDAPWQPYRNHIKRVVFSGYNSLEGVGSYAFYALPELVEVMILSGARDVGDYAFARCAKLERVLVTSNVKTVGAYAFAYCTKLAYVDLGEAIVGISNYAFDSCTSLKSFFMAPDHYGMYIGSYAFANCTAMTEVSIPCAITLADNVFQGCTNLKSIYINENNNGYNFEATSKAFDGVTAMIYYPRASWHNPNGNYGGTITWMEADFGSCGVSAKWSYDPETKKLTISGSGRICGSYFGGYDHPWGEICEEILSIEVQEGITDIPTYTFEYCEAATTIVLPSSLQTINLHAFLDCGSLNNLILPPSITFSADSIDYEFVRCESLRDVYFFGTKEEWDQIEYSDRMVSENKKIVFHFLELISQPATCTESGLEDHYRYDDTSVYGEYYDMNRNRIAQVAVIPATGHTITYADAQEKTCTQDGWGAYAYCTKCDFNTKVIIPAGHTIAQGEAQEKTCTQDGWEAYEYCTACDFSTKMVIPAGHTKTAVVIKAPDKNTAGVLQENCQNCGEMQNVTLPALNVVDYRYEVVTAATETADGYGVYTWDVTDFGVVRFYEVIRHAVIDDAAQVVINSATVVVGNTVRLEMVLKNNPGIMGLILHLDYDSSALMLQKVSGGGWQIDLDAGDRLVWTDNEEITEDGVLCVLEFQIAENAQPGEYPIAVTLLQADHKGDKTVELHLIFGVVKVISVAYGDANNDSLVSLKDVLLLRQHLANRDPNTGESTVAVEAGADANGDGLINLQDILLLRKYLANRDPSTGESTVVLGP